MKIVRITKRFGRKFSFDYKSWEFMTELTADVEVNNDHELEEASKELFKKAAKCVIADMKKVRDLLVKSGEGGNIE